MHANGKWFDGVLAWVIGVGIVMVAVSVVAVKVLDQFIIEETAATNLHAEFLRAAASVSRIITHVKGGIHDVTVLEKAFQSIFELRPGIRVLQVFELSPSAGRMILSSDPDSGLPELTDEERIQVLAGESLTRFEGTQDDRAWIITAPILGEGGVVGALRGRFSLWKYDQLIKRERELAQYIGLTAVMVTCLAFLILIRAKIHRPINRLLEAMRQGEAGDLSREAPLQGPAEIQEIAGQYNRMLNRVREAMSVKERLLGEIRGFNETLIDKVAEATKELRETNARLVAAQAQAERAEKLAALGELSAVMAHELGNPLNAISGYLQLLAQDEAFQEPEREHHLEIIRHEIERMVRTIQHILDSTRVNIQSTPVDLNEAIQEIVTLLSPGLPTRRITLNTSLQPGLPAVAGDQRVLYGLIFNLASNATQAMSNGGQLEIRTATVLDEPLEGDAILAGGPNLSSGAVRLTVRDTGHGIPPEHVDRICEPFFTTRQAEGGSGLGLAICHRVVSSCGGRLAIRSAVGEGALFTVDLPVWKSDTESREVCDE